MIKLGAQGVSYRARLNMAEIGDPLAQEDFKVLLVAGKDNWIGCA